MPSGTSGRVWSTCLVSWFSDVLMSSFLNFKGTHSPTVGFPRVTRARILDFVCLFFQTSFLTAIKPKSSQNESSQTTENHKKLQKKLTETHPQWGPVKKLSLAGAKPLKLTTFTTLSTVFAKAQSFQSRAKMEAKMYSSGTQNHEKPATQAPQKTLNKKKPRKVGPGPYLMLKTD